MTVTTVKPMTAALVQVARRASRRPWRFDFKSSWRAMDDSTRPASGVRLELIEMASVLVKLRLQPFQDLGHFRQLVDDIPELRRRDSIPAPKPLAEVGKYGFHESHPDALLLGHHAPDHGQLLLDVANLQDEGRLKILDFRRRSRHVPLVLVRCVRFPYSQTCADSSQIDLANIPKTEAAEPHGDREFNELTHLEIIVPTNRSRMNVSPAVLFW